MVRVKDAFDRVKGVCLKCKHIGYLGGGVYFCDFGGDKGVRKEVHPLSKACDRFIMQGKNRSEDKW